MCGSINVVDKYVQTRPYILDKLYERMNKYGRKKNVL